MSILERVRKLDRITNERNRESTKVGKVSEKAQEMAQVLLLQPLPLCISCWVMVGSLRQTNNSSRQIVLSDQPLLTVNVSSVVTLDIPVRNVQPVTSHVTNVSRRDILRKCVDLPFLHRPVQIVQLLHL